MKDIVIIGAGGLGKEVKFLIDEINSRSLNWNIIGFIDDNIKKGTIVHGIPILGGVKWLQGKSINAVCAVGNSEARFKIYSSLKVEDIVFPRIIHPQVGISSSVKISEGVIIQSNVSISVDVLIGRFTLLSPSTTIGHDTTLSDFVTVLPGANISGNVFIGEKVTIGTGSKIIQNIRVGNNSYLGAGAVVISDIPSNVVAVGVPAKDIKPLL
jgi:sugar O-acyltransferase (sialic acid O-acetyltransferase NeuD family)